MLTKIISYFLENKIITVLLLLLFIGWGVVTSPFNWENPILPSDPVPVDAIPDIGENQQIVFTKWQGRSPQDIEDQISYPLTTSLLGIPGVKSIRSSSVFGFSTIYLIFNEDVEFYWSRTRVLEKLNSLSNGLLPDGVQPSLGPDATALGQVYWYTLEGRDKNGESTGGWDLHEIRTVQDFYVKYGLNSVDGVSEVASIGGHTQEYQIDVNPNALEVYNISLHQVMKAVSRSNKDVGAKTIEINKAEYLIRGLGNVKSIEDIEKAVVSVNQNVPITIKDIAVVSLGPSTRRGLLDKGGAEVVGGVVVSRYGSNPLQVINNVKDKIQELKQGMPSKILPNGIQSTLTIVPFYDRTQLINETLGTLEEALSLEFLITILVVLVMLLNLRASILISSILPISVLMVFIAMRYFHVEANIVALSGIAIAIGTMVDLGIVLSENILKHIKDFPSQKLIDTVRNATSEVSSAIVAAVATTIVSFIPVFTLEAAEGKLFQPLAFTKTFALLSALIVALIILPTLANWLFGFKMSKNFKGKAVNILLIVSGLFLSIWISIWAGAALMVFGLAGVISELGNPRNFVLKHLRVGITLFFVIWFLANEWVPLGPNKSAFLNFIFVGILITIILGTFFLLEKYYQKILNWCLMNKAKFLMLPVVLIFFSLVIWQGFSGVFGFVPKGFKQLNIDLKSTYVWKSLDEKFPGLGEEFMPNLDEGSFLVMPTSMPHSGMQQNKMMVQQLDMLMSQIPEVELAVGKMGRAETALDPAPISMFENIVNYKPQFIVNEQGHKSRFKVDKDSRFILKSKDSLSNEEALSLGIVEDDLIPDANGEYFRNWRKHIQSPDDIWKEIVKVSKIPGLTSAPKLQPIQTRLVMLQTGMRAPMGIKVFGPDLKSIESFGLKLETILKDIPEVKADVVFAERIVGKPYIHLNINREAIALHGLSVIDIQENIETAIGGMQITSTIEGRERFPVRVRYPRELRDDPEDLKRILISTPLGNKVPLSELVDIEYVKGPQMIKSENTFLVGYVLFDKNDGLSEVEVVEKAKEAIKSKVESGELIIPPGINYKFSGNYENQIRAEKRLSIIVPVVLIIIFIILYFQFKSVSTSLMIFMGIAMSFSGAFIMIWLYGEEWAFNFSLFDTNMRHLFQMHSINLSVAVWVGFIALFGISTDDGVLMGTYLDQSFLKNSPNTKAEIRNAVLKAGQKRIKPAIMTTATTMIALLPVLTSTGKGADIMIPMAIPAFGGMAIASITYFIVPVLYSIKQERKLKKQV